MKLKKQIIYWLDEKRDMIVVSLIIFVVLISVVLGMRMQQNYTVQQRLEEEAKKPKKVKLAKDNAEKKAGQGSAKPAPSASFFLKPSPDEVLSLIQEMGEGELPPDNQKYTGLRVMWPAYFFQIVSQQAGNATILLDVSADGFGVMIQTDVDLAKFPDILSIERGKKIWVAGELLGVDGKGTGTIIMTAEEVRFAENLEDAIKTHVGPRDNSTQVKSSDGQTTKEEAEKQ